MKQVREVQTWRQVREPAGAVMCETRDLAALAHTDTRRRQKHRYEICLPKRCEENASAAGPEQSIGRSGQQRMNMKN